MVLHKISLSKLHVLETGQFIIRYISDFDGLSKNPTTDPIFNNLHAAILDQSPVYNRALGQIKAKAESEILLNLDIVRDKKITTLRRAWNLYEHSDVPTEIEAYGRIKVILKNYKGLEFENYEAETLGIDNFITELRLPINKEFVQTLGMLEHIKNLESANTNFKTIFNKRSNETVGTEVFETKKLRANILSAYTELADYIVVMARQHKTSYYIDILTSINNGRKYYSDILAKRGGKGDSKNPSAAS
jgi:hypothetical protein